MKKITKIVLAFALGVTMLFAAVGCTAGVRLTSIAWDKLPSTEYTWQENAMEAESIALLKFSITLTTESPSKTITVTETNLKNGVDLSPTENVKIIIEKFSVAEKGTSTATVTIGKFLLSFNYTVTDPASELVVGEGTETNPYLLSNAAQFAQIMLGDISMRNGDKFYKITADIDLSQLPKEYAQKLATLEGDTYPTFKGTIDGGKYTVLDEYTGTNWKLMNYTSQVTSALSGTDYQPGLFFLLDTCTFKNIDLVNFKLDNSSAAGAGFFGVGRYKTKEVSVKQPTFGGKLIPIKYTFKNINIVDSYMNTFKNSGGFVGYTNEYTCVYVDNCTIDDKTMLMAAPHREIGGFVGTNNTPNITPTPSTAAAKDEHDKVALYTNENFFTNCSNASTMSAADPGALIGNTANMSNEHSKNQWDVRVENCKFTGTMYSTFSYPDPKPSNIAITNTKKDAHTINPWLGSGFDFNSNWHNYIKYTNSNSVGSKFYDITGNTTTKYTHSIKKIEVTSTDADNNLKFKSIAGATSYVASYNFAINRSTYAVSEEFEQPMDNATPAQPIIGATMATTFVKPTAIYDSEHSTGKTASLSTGVLLIPSDFTKTIQTIGSKVEYTIIAYDKNDIPIAVAKGIFKDFGKGENSMMTIVNKP